MPSHHEAMWKLHTEHVSALQHHGRDLPFERSIWDVRVTQTAIVLGSRQHESLLNVEMCKRDRIEIVQRRSGGGIVYLEPNKHVWLDVVIPRDDELWSDDVAKASWWLGEVWINTLNELGIANISVHHDSLQSDAWGDLLCFAGIGPGEVVVQSGDAVSKVVGISQRRSRDYARFQCTLYMEWNPHIVGRYLQTTYGSLDEVVSRASAVLATPQHVVDTFVSHLPL